MARYNGLIIPRSYNDYYSRSDPQAIRDIVSLAADGELNAESKNPLQNQAIAKIVPATASETNELADKNFVNSTVGTNTANYIYKTESGGEKVPFSSVAELEAYAGTVTNNDYAFVTGIDENGNAYYDRYKADVNDGVVTWAKEYRLNNSSFTAEQWAAIQSGITAEKVAQFEGAVSPVNVVQSGNMSAVTSNAVYEALVNYSNVTLKTTFADCITTDKKSGVFLVIYGNDTTHRPNADIKHWLVEYYTVVEGDNTQHFQRATSIGGQVNNYNACYFRLKVNNAEWGNWQKLVTESDLINFAITEFARPNEMWGYYVKCGTRCFCHIKFILTTNISDWGAIAPRYSIAPAKKSFAQVANGKSSSKNSIYINTDGSIQQGGGGGMDAGTYEFDFDYEIA